jgi:hypothetical protein
MLAPIAQKCARAANEKAKKKKKKKNAEKIFSPSAHFHHAKLKTISTHHHPEPQCSRVARLFMGPSFTRADQPCLQTFLGRFAWTAVSTRMRRRLASLCGTCRIGASTLLSAETLVCAAVIFRRTLAGAACLKNTFCLNVVPAHANPDAPGIAERLKNVCVCLDDELQVDMPHCPEALPSSNARADAPKHADQAVSTWGAHVRFLMARIDALLAARTEEDEERVA